jgi:hypothetical protein
MSNLVPRANMIARNEVVNLKHSLAAVADHFIRWVNCDNGSSDGSRDFVRSLVAHRGVRERLMSSHASVRAGAK